MGGQSYSTSQFVPASPEATWESVFAAVKAMSDFKLKDSQPQLLRMELRKGHGWKNSPMSLVVSVRPEGSGALVTVEGVSMDTRMMANGAREVQREATRLLGALRIKEQRSYDSSSVERERGAIPDLASRLSTLKELLEQELISSDEYAAKRAAILDEI